MTIDIRPTAPDEWRVAADTFRGALLHGPTTDEEWAKPWIAGSWEGSDSITAWEDGRCIGHAGAFRFLTMVPGGAVVPTAGVTRVGVRQTSTRRGVLTGMMTRLLRDARDQGTAVASLRASESVIYGRFGFGIAGEAWTPRSR